MNFFILLFLTWIISQTLKSLFKNLGRHNFSLKETGKTYLYYSGIPSSHAAVLTAAFFYLLKKLGPENPIFQISTLFILLWLYEIYLQRRRINALIHCMDVDKIKDEDLLILKDLHGHNLVDFIVGIGLGFSLFLIFNNFFSV